MWWLKLEGEVKLLNYVCIVHYNSMGCDTYAAIMKICCCVLANYLPTYLTLFTRPTYISTKTHVQINSSTIWKTLSKWPLRPLDLDSQYYRPAYTQCLPLAFLTVTFASQPSGSPFSGLVPFALRQLPSINLSPQASSSLPADDPFAPLTPAPFPNHLKLTQVRQKAILIWQAGSLPDLPPMPRNRIHENNMGELYNLANVIGTYAIIFLEISSCALIAVIELQEYETLTQDIRNVRVVPYFSIEPPAHGQGGRLNAE